MLNSARLSDYHVILAATSGRVSGVDVFSANLVRGLNNLNMKAHVLMTCHDESPLDQMPLPRDIPVQKLPVGKFCEWRPLEGGRVGAPSQKPFRPFAEAGSLRGGRASWRTRWQRVTDYLEGQAPSIYIPNYDWHHSCVSPQLSQKVGIVGIVHSDDPLHYEHVSRLGRYWNAIVAVSPAIAAHVAALDPTLVPRLVTIPYGVEVPPSLPERHREANAPLKVVYAGRLVQEQKRVGELPKIMSALHRRGVPVELTIIGSGSEEAELMNACAPPSFPPQHWGGKKGGAGLVRFLGTLPNARVLEIFEQSDVFILTSDYEGLPLSLLEAMGRGCVPVVTDIRSGIPELVRDGVNGYRVPVGDIQAFAERLATLQRLPGLRRALASQAYQTIRTEGYDVQSMIERYLMLFERVLREAETGVYRRPRGKILPPHRPPCKLRRHGWRACPPLYAQ